MQPITEVLIPDRQRFPSGIRTLADYIHSKGLKLGLYTDIGTLTCAGYPGLQIQGSTATDYFLLDAFTFANWTIDSIKVDGCYASVDEFPALYPRFGEALNMTGKPTILSFSLIALFLHWCIAVYR